MAFEVFWAVYVNFYCISKENYGSINIYNNVELFLNRKLVSIFKSVSMKTVSHPNSLVFFVSGGRV